MVSVTRIAVGRDKRTFQIAASFGRLGWESIVVEGEPSGLPPAGLPFDLLTIDGAGSIAAVSNGAERPPEGRSAIRRLLDGLPRPVFLALRAAAGGLLRSRIWFQLGEPFVLLYSFCRDNLHTLRALPRADVYYLTFFWQFPAIWLAARRNRARFVYDANDAYWAWPGYQWYPRLFRALLGAVEWCCVRSASAFITVSDGVADLLEQRYGRRPTVVRNLHDSRVDQESVVDVRTAAGLGEDAFLLVVPGNEKPSDAISEVLEALARLPERVHLALLGKGYEKHLEEAERLGVEERIHLLPPVPPTEVTSAIRTADAGLINTRAQDVHLHALPTRLFSAVAAGLPVLYPPLPEVRALAEEHRLGLPIDAEDPESIAAAVRSLSENGKLATEYRANVERAQEALSWEREEERLAGMIHSSLPGGS